MVGMALVIAVSASAQVATDKTALGKIRREIDALKAQLTTLETRQSTIARELEATELRLNIAERELVLLADAEAVLLRDRERLTAEAGRLERSVARQKRLVGRRLNALYRMGNLGYLRMLLSVQPQSNPFESISMLAYLASRDGREFERLRDMTAELERNRQKIDESSRTLATVQADARQRRQELASERQRQTALLARVEGEAKRSSARLVELEEKARRLERLLEILYSNNTEALAGRDIREFRGALPWPLNGKVLVPFGRQRSDRFATYTMHNGIRIAGQENDRVQAVFPGRVLYAQWFRGYGNLVIVDHGHRVFSLYANTRMSTVAKGDQVQAGQVIATVASGEAEELPPHLYFEIREDNQPVDPRGWVR